MKINRSQVFLLLLSSFIIIGFLSCGDEDSVNETARVSFTLDNLVEVENASIALSLNVNIDNPEHNGGTINISINGGTYGTDYETTTGSSEFTMDIEPNVLLASFAIMPIDDELIEGDLPLTITITGVSGALQLGDQNTMTLTILDDDKSPDPVKISFAETNAAFAEGDPLEKIIMLNLSEPLLTNATIEVEIQSSSTAELGTDYTINGGSDNMVTLELAAGISETSFNIKMIDDADEEDEESINITLANPSSNLEIELAQSEMTLTIIDNDGSIPPIDYFENFESNDGTTTFLNDVLGFQNVVVNQTIDAGEILKLVTSAGNFSDESDPTMTSDNGINIFYNSAQDPTLFGELDNLVITPLMEGVGLIDINIDVAYAFASQNNGTATFYWSETYDGSGNFNQSEWTELGTETAETMSADGFGNNTYKRKSFNINASQPFYVAIRVNQSIDDTYYRTRWRFDNIRVAN